MVTSYPVQFDVDLPTRPLDRLTTGLRIFAAIPILILLGLLSRDAVQGGDHLPSGDVGVVVERAYELGPVHEHHEEVRGGKGDGSPKQELGDARASHRVEASQRWLAARARSSRAFTTST